METRIVLFEKTCKSFVYTLSYEQCEIIILRRTSRTYLYQTSSGFFIISNFSLRELNSLSPYNGEKEIRLFFKEVKPDKVENILFIL